MVNFNLSGIPDFRAQFAQRLSQFQDWREPRENLQIEGTSPLQIMGPPEASHPLEILSRDDFIQSQISQCSQNSSGTQVRATRRKLEHPQLQLPNLGVLQQSIQWANPREEDMEKREATRVHTPPSIAEEVQSLGRRFDHLSPRLLEQDQTFNQVKGDIRRLYQDNGDAKQHQGRLRTW